MEMTGMIVENLSGTLTTKEAVLAGLALGGGGILVTIIGLGSLFLLIAGTWKMFKKANLPGWGVLIPFYNIYLFIKLAGRPGRWFLLLLVPIVNIIVGIILNFDIAKRFGKGFGYGLGLLFFPMIFSAILGFGDAKYHPVEENSEVIEA